MGDNVFNVNKQIKINEKSTVIAKNLFENKILNVELLLIEILTFSI